MPDCRIILLSQLFLMHQMKWFTNYTFKKIFCKKLNKLYILYRNNKNSPIIENNKGHRKVVFHCTSVPSFIHFKQPLFLLKAVLTLMLTIRHVLCLNSSSYNSNHVSVRQDGCHVLPPPPHLIWCSGCWNNYSSLCQTIHLCSLTEDRKENGRIHIGV